MKMSPLRITFSQDPIKGNQAEQAMILVWIGFSIDGESKELATTKIQGTVYTQLRKNNFYKNKIEKGR